jgi:beta-galactosidase
MPAITLPPPPVPSAEVFHLGAARNPAGAEIGVDSTSLLLNGRRWMPVMGELHYTRVPADRWREELLKMKAGGIDCVASYVFWIHHEETEGTHDWSGDRDLRRFVAAVRDAGLTTVVRLGPWCHGEVRNGGLPDWVVSGFGEKARTDDPAYLAVVRRHFAAIAAQLEGLLWKQGGPIVAFQIENEYFGPAEHLLTIKRLAAEAGLDAPFYTRTGWFDPSTPVPFGELLPLYGGYPEGFWDREIKPMPNAYPANFRFSPRRTDVGIASDLKGGRDAHDPADTARYPFLTCEIGGGMMSAYHRRIRIDPRDIESVVLCKLGSGGNLPGYYMYHGGINPEGLTSLQESQATRYWNDLPEKNYDFQAPLGAAGQLRSHYHGLRRLHLFIRDHGSLLAGLPARFPSERPSAADDVSTLRWSARSDGRQGFVFVNNYERLRELPAKPDVRFSLALADGARVEFPSSPVTIPSGASFIWPFGLELAPGVRLDHASAQLLCHVDEGKVRTVFFAATAGIPAEFAFNGSPAATLTPGLRVALAVSGLDGAELRVVLLDEADSRALWKAEWRGRERVFLTRAGLTIDGDTLRLSAENPADLAASVFPALESATGLFTPLALSPVAERLSRFALVPHVLKTAGPARDIPLGWTKPAVAVAPVDADFAAAATWRIELPSDFDPAATPLLRLRYVGDVIRIRVGDRFVLDDFFNGDVVEFDLTRVAAELAAGAPLTIEILPLRPDAPILLPEGTRPTETTARLDSAEIVSKFTASF